MTEQSHYELAEDALTAASVAQELLIDALETGTGLAHVYAASADLNLAAAKVHAQLAIADQLALRR